MGSRDVRTTVNSAETQQPLVLVEAKKPTGLVLIFHGAGADARQFQRDAEDWCSELPHVKFLMPTAPVRGRMTAWFGFNSKTGRLINYDGVWHQALEME